MKGKGLIRVTIAVIIVLVGMLMPYQQASAASSLTEVKSTPGMVSLFGDNKLQTRSSILGPGWTALTAKTVDVTGVSTVKGDLWTSFLKEILPSDVESRVLTAKATEWASFKTGLQAKSFTLESGSGATRVWSYYLQLEDILALLPQFFPVGEGRRMVVQNFRLGDKTIPVTLTDTGVTPTVTSTANITLTVVDAQIALRSGWNLRSTPLALDAASDTWGELRALGRGTMSSADLAALFPQGFYFDASAQVFASLTASKTLQPLEAIYVNTTSDVPLGAILLRGTVGQPPSRNLAVGFNLIGSSPDFSVNFTSAYDGKLRGMMPVDQALISVLVAPGASSPLGYSAVVSPGEAAVTRTETYSYTGVSLGSYNWWFGQPTWSYARGGSVSSTMPSDGNRWVSPFGGYWVGMDNADILLGYGVAPVSDAWLVTLLTLAP